MKALLGYRGSDQFKIDTITDVKENPQEATEAICVDEMVARRVIHGFFNSPTTNCLLSKMLSWAISIGAAQMQ